MNTVRVYNIEWDTDGENSPILPSEIILKLNASENDIEDIISDYLSDTFGYCHNGFNYKTQRRKHRPALRRGGAI